MEITNLRTKVIGMKTIADNNQPLNQISYRQQLSTLQNESQQETKKRKPKRNHSNTTKRNR